MCLGQTVKMHSSNECGGDIYMCIVFYTETYTSDVCVYVAGSVYTLWWMCVSIIIYTCIFIIVMNTYIKTCIYVCLTYNKIPFIFNDYTSIFTIGISKTFNLHKEFHFFCLYWYELLNFLVFCSWNIKCLLYQVHHLVTKVKLLMYDGQQH